MTEDQKMKEVPVASTKPTTALLVIDVQVALMELMSPALRECALPRIGELATRARGRGWPVLYVQHDGGPRHILQAGQPGWALHPAILHRTGDPVIGKRECDAFFDTPLADELAARGITRLIIAGAMTEYCIDTNCRRATSLGYDVTLAADAHLTRDNKILKAEQIVAHHNKLLSGFGAGPHRVTVQPAGAIAS